MRGIKKAALYITALGVALFVFGSVAAGGAPDYVVQRHEQMIQNAVQIGGEPHNATGSGIIIYSQEDGSGWCRNYVLTNEHVVNNDNDKANDDERHPLYTYNYGPNLNDIVGTTKHELIVLYSDPQLDLAFGTFRSARCVTAAKIGNSADVYFGEDAWAVGFGKGELLAVSPGVLGAIYPLSDLLNNHYRRFTGNIQPGNSGGGLFHLTDKGYELAGVIGACRYGSVHPPSPFGSMYCAAGFGFAVPIESVHRFLQDSGFGFLFGQPQVAVK